MEDRRLVLVSFADRRYRNAMKRLEGYTEKFPFTERHFCDETNTFDKKYWRKLKPWLYRRGYGYWEWKADLVKSYVDQLEEGDIVVYSDGGICWNSAPTALRRFDEYLQMVSPEKPILAFQEPYVEQEWTKGDLLKAAGVYDNENVCTSNQLWGGSFLLMKSAVSMRFLQEWIALNDLSRELITDRRSAVPNREGFKEHRHDQSSFSVLVKMFPHVEVSWRETQVEDRDNPEAWDCMSEFPILAKRTKEIGRPRYEVLKNKLLRPWRMFLNFYFRKVRNYEFASAKYPW